MVQTQPFWHKDAVEWERPPHRSRSRPKYSRKRGKTPVLSQGEARQLFDSIPTDTVIGKRDRALLGVMTYTLAWIGAAISMEVRDVYQQNRRLWVRLQEKGGKQAELPCYYSLETYLDHHLDAAGLRELPRAPLLQTIRLGTGSLSGNPLSQSDD